jgi:hypothetical protein
MTKYIIGLRSGALNQLKLSEASYGRLNHHNRVQEFSCPRRVRRKYYEVLFAHWSGGRTNRRMVWTWTATIWLVRRLTRPTEDTETELYSPCKPYHRTFGSWLDKDSDNIFTFYLIFALSFQAAKTLHGSPCDCPMRSWPQSRYFSLKITD